MQPPGQRTIWPGGWRKLLNEELYGTYSSLTIIRVIKSRWTRWAGHVTHVGVRRGSYRNLVEKPEGKRPLGRRGRHCRDHKILQINRVLNKNNPIHILIYFPLMSILKLPFHLRLWLPNSYFLSGPSTKILRQRNSPTRVTCPIHLSVHNLINLTIFIEDYNYWSSIRSN